MTKRRRVNRYNHVNQHSLPGPVATQFGYYGNQTHHANQTIPELTGSWLSSVDHAQGSQYQFGNQWYSGGCQYFQPAQVLQQANPNYQALYFTHCQQVLTSNQLTNIDWNTLGNYNPNVSFPPHSSLPPHLLSTPLQKPSLTHEIAPQTNPNGTKQLKMDKLDQIIVLFDLNGTLIDKKKRSFIMRPGIECLVRLKNKFRVGVFSSAMAHTVRQGIAAIEQYLQSDGHLEQNEHLFDQGVVKHRDHTIHLSQKRKREVDKPHGTYKPLGKNFADLRRVVLIDNDEFKAAKGEKENLVLLPTWESQQEFAQNDNVLKILVNELINQLDNALDVREHTSQISRLLFV